MAAVRHESQSLENLKAQMKSMEEVKKEIPVLKEKLQFAEESLMAKNREKKCADEAMEDLKADLQRLNDMYANERKQNLESQEKQLSLQQELDLCKLEMDKAVKAAPRIAELQKSNQAQKLQIDILKQNLEEEQRAVQKGVQLMEKQTEEAEQCKAELSQHFWSVSEELKQTQEQLQGAQQVSQQLEQALVAMGERVEQSQGELQQAAVSQQSLKQDFEKKNAAALHDLEEKNKRLSDGKANLVVQLAEHQSQLAEADKHIRTIEENHKKYQAEKDEELAKLQDEVLAQGRLREEISTLTSKLATQKELENKFKADVEEWEKKYEDLNATYKSETHAKSDALLSIQNSSTVHKALENQLKEANQKHWQEIQKTKGMELEFESKIESLQQSVSDKDMRIQSLEEEREKIQEMYQEEVGRISHVSGVLKAELEKRLDELGSCSKERDELKADNSKLQSQIDNVEENLKKKEKVFAHVVETDRNKIANEMKSKNNRLRALENEKQDLLKETQHLMDQISLEQKAKTESIKDYKKAKVRMEEAEEECRVASTEANKYKRECDRLLQAEAQLKTQLQTSEEQFRTDITRLDGIVKNSKRTAAQQVTDLSNKVKALQDELNDERTHKESLVESEKTATSNAEKFSTQLEALKLEFEEFQFNAAKEIAAAKRDSQHTSGKVKSLLDIKSKMEMELVQLRLERARSGSDVTHLADRVKELEGKVESQTIAIRKADDENEKLLANNRRLKSNEIDAEAALSKSTKQLTKAKEEIERIEKHSMIESKKMRTQLNAMNRKIHESEDIIANLQEEAESYNTSYTKLQNTSNKTITGLIEELKRTEELLVTERKTNNQEISTMQHHLTEMRTKLENTTHSMQEKMYHHQNDKTDKENLLNQLNAEASRLKALCNTREERIAELEKQHQEDRSKMQVLRNEVVAAENSVADMQLEVAKSETKRKNLEEKIEQMEDKAEDWKREHGNTLKEVQASYEYNPSGGGALDNGIGSIDEYSNDYYGGSIASSYDVDPKYKLFIDHEDVDDDAHEVAEEDSVQTYTEDQSNSKRPTSHKEANKYSPSSYKRDKPQHSAPAKTNFRHSPIVDKYDEFALQQDIEEEEGINSAISAANNHRSSYGYKKEPSDEVEEDITLDTRRVNDSIDMTQKYLQKKSKVTTSGDEDAESVAASIARTQRFLKRRGVSDGGSEQEKNMKNMQEKSKRTWGSLAQQEGKQQSPSPDQDKRKQHTLTNKSPVETKQQQNINAGGRVVSGANFLHDTNDEDDNDGMMFNINAPGLVPATPPSSIIRDEQFQENVNNSNTAAREKASIQRMKKKKEPSTLNFDNLPKEGLKQLGSARSSARSSAHSSARSRGYEMQDEEDYEMQLQQQAVGVNDLLLPRISPRQKSSSRNGKKSSRRK